MSTHPAFHLDWNLVRTFVAVAQSGSLSAGAATMGITHPTAARHISQLEEHLGMALFTRTGQGLRLNDAGMRLQQCATQMHAQALEFESQSDSLRALPVATLRISVAQVFAELMSDVVFSQMGGTGKAALEMHVTNELVNLLARDADLAIRHVRPDQQELVCRSLGVLPIGLYATEEYLNEYGPFSLDDLSGHRFVDGLSKSHLCAGATAHNLSIGSEQIVFRSDCLAGQRRAISAGIGIGAYPVWCAEEIHSWQNLLPNMNDVHASWLDLDVWLVARPEVRDNDQLKSLFSRIGDAVAKRLHAGMATGIDAGADAKRKSEQNQERNSERNNERNGAIV